MRSEDNISDFRSVTFGELCEAIAEEELPAARQDEFYLVSRGDLKRFIQPNSPERISALFELLPSKPAQKAS